MEIYLFIISIILIVVGCILVIAEALSGETDFLNPIALICFILGIIFWFASNPASWLLSRAWFVFLTIIIFGSSAIFFGFSLFITVKMIKLKKAPLEDFDFSGKTAKVVEEIQEKKEGYIRFRGELWKARSDKNIKVGQEVRIMEKEDLILIVEPKESVREKEPEEVIQEKQQVNYCPSCGEKFLEKNIKICPNCGVEI